MASGKASKRKRTAERQRALVVEQRRGFLASRWVLVVVVATVVLAFGLGLAINAGTSGSSPSEGGTLSNAEEAAAPFAGIPQQGTVLGRADAPVTIVEFVDLQCPFCREFAVKALPTLVEKHVRSGKARLEIRGLSFVGPDSERGLRAVLAAGNQNWLFPLMELLYFNQGPENSGWLDQDLIEAAARSFPAIDVARLVDDMDSGVVSEALDEHAAAAEQGNVSSTPSFLVGPTGGELAKVTVESATDLDAIERAIAAVR